MANLQMTGILEKMTGKDKDYRYMATSDLLNELNKEDFKADADLKIKLSNIVFYSNSMMTIDTPMNKRTS
uniref:Uncharacterized protein n=1 Tax=Salix viminalis TaxID=40686 RepID=A0A6N2KQ46_SALVM